MVINIASFGGRTHMLDTARELEKFGHTVRFYSYVPTKRAVKYGLKKECSYSIFWFALPFLCLYKLFGHGLWREDLYNWCCDLFLSFYMKPCDVFIGQSPMHLKAIKRAKRKYGAVTILERGISHVLYQEKILREMNPAHKFMTHLHVERDLKGYQYPDYISVGSDHVRETFLENGYPDDKIFVNNYGVNLNFFHPTKLCKDIQYDILIVGQWCKRKGCDQIVEAARKRGYKVLHVGAIVDIPFPNDTNFTHVDPVSEDKLISYYERSRVFVMPSRDEGLALVQPQALACGLPLVCSDRSGGRDLKKAVVDDKYIIEMEHYTVECLIESIDKAIVLSYEQDGAVRNILKEDDSLSYEAYGKRYNDFINRITG